MSGVEEAMLRTTSIEQLRSAGSQESGAWMDPVMGVILCAPKREEDFLWVWERP